MSELDGLDLPEKKPKQKKKLTFNLDNLDSEFNIGDAIPKQSDEDLLSMDFSNQKKKKKKKIFNVNDIDKVLNELDINDNASVNDEKAITNEKDIDSNNVDAVKKSEENQKLSDDELLAMDFTNQKKKKKKKIFNVDDIDKVEAVSQSNALHSTEDDSTTWKGSDRDYTYDELLTRAFDIIREKNPEMASGKKQKFVMRPPQVVRIGTKKTSFANFTEICKILHRQEKHLLDFLLAELGTSGSVDGNLQLVIKGRFQQKQIENVLRRYIKEYVTCHTCKSLDTILQKDTRLFFLQCEICGSRCSVASIKSGFQAVTAKRAAIRAKTA